jgi:hypothetical protein
VTGADSGQNGPEPLDRDRASQKLCERGRRPLAGGERRCTTVMTLGCSNLHMKKHRDEGKLTVNSTGGRRDGGGDAGRPAAAAHVRGPRFGSAEHNDKNEWHLRAPYLAATSRATFTVAEEQRMGRLTAAVAVGFAAAAVSSGASVSRSKGRHSRSGTFIGLGEAALACGPAARGSRGPTRGRGPCPGRSLTQC